MAENENLHWFIDDSELKFLHEHPDWKTKPSLNSDLLMLQVLSEDEDCCLDPDDRLAKLKQELAAHSITITSDTDIKALADMIKTFGITDY